MIWALIQGLLAHGVAAWQLRVGEMSETHRATLQACLGVLAAPRALRGAGAMSGKRLSQPHNAGR